MELEAGLHMVSIPVQGADMSVDTLFPDGTTVRTWDPDTKSYVEATTIDPTKSYWVDVPSECTVTVSGTPLDGWTATLSAGWHMIGSLYGDPVGVETISADPSSALEGSSVYCWNPSTGRYDVATQIEQGKGYWVVLSEACELTVGTPGDQ